MSGMMNKAKVAVDKVIHPEAHKTGDHSTNAGPHNSNMANQADPRVDSDRDGSRNMGAATGTSGYGSGTTGTAGTMGHNTTHGSGTTGTMGHNTTHGSTNAGPHSSNLANKADPRVDSNLDGSRTAGTGAGYGSGTTGAYGASGNTSTLGHGHTHGSTNAGPHSSNLVNQADPRVDSDMDGSRNMGASSGYGGNTLGGHGSQTAGPHNSNLANKADPRVDSNLDGSRTVGGGAGYGSAGHTGNATSGLSGSHGQSGLTGASGHSGITGVPGSGPAPNTAGPHKSDMLNKVDPRVDSDLDGSRTTGGNKTYQDLDGSPDAASHKPSEFRKRLSAENLPDDSDHSRRHTLADLGAKGTFDKYGAGHQ